MKKLYSFYRIYDDQEDYIGVTSQQINSRMSKHYYRAFMEKKQSKLSTHIRECGFPPNFKYEVFDQEELTEEDARNKEMLYIKLLQPSLNTQHAS